MLAASRLDHPAPRITLTMPTRRRFRASFRCGSKCDGMERHTFQFPQANLNQYEIAAERRRARAITFRSTVAATVVIIAMLVIALHVMPKAYANLPITLAQAEAMRGM